MPGYPIRQFTPGLGDHDDRIRALHDSAGMLAQAMRRQARRECKTTYLPSAADCLSYPR